MATISTDFTAVGSSAVLRVPTRNEVVSVAISGTYDMTIVLQRATSPAELAWETIKTWTTANATVAFDHKSIRDNEHYRLTVLVDAGGTAVTTLIDEDKIDSAVRNSEGEALYSIRQSGVLVHVPVQSDFDVGVVGTGVTAKHYSADGINFTTVLTLAGVAVTVGDNVSLAFGALIYTLPAGDIAIKACAMSVGITALGTPTTDDPVIGIGTVIGSTAIATLTTATMQDILSEIASVNMVGTAVVFADQKPMDMLAANAHTIHINGADAFADMTGVGATFDGTVTLSWSKLPLS